MSTTTLETSPTVEAILRWDEGRPPELLRLKYERMGRDMFAFFRGANHLFAASWPELVPLDPGPDLLACGDLHLENFGGYRAEDGAFYFDINDFDEAVVGPCSLDLIRCSTSILLAAQVWGLTPIRAIRTVLGYLDRYRSTILEEAQAPPDALAWGLDESAPILSLLGDCAMANQEELLAHLTRIDKSGHRSIRRSEGKLEAPGKKAAASVVEAVEAHGVALGQPEAFRVLDVASRIAGIGSLGVKRYVALVEGDGSPEGARLLDLKAASPSAVLGCTRGPQPSSWTSEALRVIKAQQGLQAKPTAGLASITVDGEEFRVREMIPEENRARLDRLRRKPSKLGRAVELAGRITARSQLRGARLEDGVDRTSDLGRWAASPALDAVLTSAVRFAEQTRVDYKRFKKARLDLMVD